MRIRYLIKIGEMTLKGGNKALFERQLRHNMQTLLGGVRHKITIRDRRFYLDADESDAPQVEEALSKVFGIVAFTRTRSCEKDMGELQAASAGEVERYIGSRYGEDPSQLGERSVSFKIDARRTDKSFPYTSYQIASEVGEFLDTSYPFLRVDVKNPDLRIRVEIREDVYVYVDEKRGPGGLPVGSAGKGMLMLSGGIDSPVAGYLMAKRGLSLDAVYFHAYPYTSEDALDKVKNLASILGPYFVGTNLYVVPFTDYQLELKKRARAEEITLLMRAGMVRISELLAKHTGAGALVSGESLSQVASQTLESLRFTGGMTDIPVFRPLIGLDKEEIIRIARDIGTYETSILPFDDCCTIFTPEHPLVKPGPGRMEASWKHLDAEDILKRAADDAEKVFFPPRPSSSG